MAEDQASEREMRGWALMRAELEAVFPGYDAVHLGWILGNITGELDWQDTCEHRYPHDERYLRMAREVALAVLAGRADTIRADQTERLAG